MNADDREVVEGIQYQGVDEKIVYTIDTANWGGTPSSPSVVVKDVTNALADVTATVMPSGSPTISTDVITLPKLQDLTENHTYRIELKFNIAGNDLEAYCIVIAQL
jgi:hypothetical protein